MSSSIKGCLPSKVVFHHRLSSIKGHLPSKVVCHQRLFPMNSLGFDNIDLLCFNYHLLVVLFTKKTSISALTASSWYPNIQIAKIAKIKKIRIFEKIPEIFCHHESVRHWAKIQYFELKFFFCKHPYFYSTH